MKNIFLKITFVVFAVGTLSSCNEEETAIPTTTVTVAGEDFQTAVNSTDLDLLGTQRHAWRARATGGFRQNRFQVARWRLA